MNLHAIDYFCIIFYLLFIIILGSCFGRQQKTTKNYFLAGKSMRWLPLAISMYASIFSSISYIMAPAEAFRFDMQWFVALAMFPVASIFSIILFIDFYTRLRITTVYEYIEARFNRLLSTIIVMVFILYRCLYASIVVFSLSLVLHVTMGIPLIPAIIGIGAGAIIYTTLGGMKAVIWTDVVQFFFIVGGLVLALLIAISKIPGGVSEVVRIAGESGKLRVINPEFNLTARYVFWTLVPYGFIEFLGSKTVDQINVQRYLSARTPQNAKLAMLIQSFFTMPVWFILYCVGMCLFAYYTIYPSSEVSQFITDNKYDRIFPYYIYSVMPIGIRGFMVAALLAAAMSTMDSVLNVLSTITVVNIYKKFVNKDASERNSLMMAKILTCLWGIVVIVLATRMIHIESILKTINSIAGILIGPIVGVFVLGMFFRRTNSLGTLLGMLLAFPPLLYLKYKTNVTFTLYGITGLTVTIVAGYLLSFLSSVPSLKKESLLIWKWRGLREMLLGGTKETIDLANQGKEGKVYE